MSKARSMYAKNIVGSEIKVLSSTAKYIPRKVIGSKLPALEGTNKLILFRKPKLGDKKIKELLTGVEFDYIKCTKGFNFKWLLLPELLPTYQFNYYTNSNRLTSCINLKDTGVVTPEYIKRYEENHKDLEAYRQELESYITMGEKNAQYGVYSRGGHKHKSDVIIHKIKSAKNIFVKNEKNR